MPEFSTLQAFGLALIKTGAVVKSEWAWRRLRCHAPFRAGEIDRTTLIQGFTLGYRLAAFRAYGWRTR